MGDKIIVTGKNSEKDYIFRPSEKLSFYIYQMYLQVASCQELENDTLDVQTHWKLIDYIGENDKGYEVFWDNNIAVTRDPAEENNKYKFDSSTGTFTPPKKPKKNKPISELSSEELYQRAFGDSYPNHGLDRMVKKLDEMEDKLDEQIKYNSALNVYAKISQEINEI